MLQSEVFPYYRKCISEMEDIYNYLISIAEKDSLNDLLQMRGYVPDSSQHKYLSKNNILAVNLEDSDLLGKNRVDLGLVTSNDNFLLNNRYLIPVNDTAGNLVAMIGYYADFKKYITTPSPFFSKDVLFFNFADAYKLSWSEYNGYVVLVEGIFDCLSLKSIGLPAIATMGSSVSKVKGELLKSFKKVLAIPDDDATGRKALNRYSKFGWQVPSNTTFLKFKGGYFSFDGVLLKCKDMDNFVSWYEENDVREILLSYADSKEDIEELSLE